jgi:hypothetical protein
MDKNETVQTAPVDRFRAWWDENRADIEDLRVELGLDSGRLIAEKQKIEAWLIRYQHSAKARKKNWLRFIKNWLPNLNADNQKGKTNRGYRKRVSEFTGESGQRRM